MRAARADKNALKGRPEVQKAPKLADREALQGWWTVDKLAIPNNANDSDKDDLMRQDGRMHFLVSGDVFWKIVAGRSVTPQRVQLNATKNPKWVTLSGVSPDQDRQDRAIYELSGDTLRVCMSVRGNGPRPAEFTREFSSPGDEPLMLLHLRRGKPLPVGEKALAGSWVGNPTSAQETIHNPNKHTPAQRAEVTGGYLFAQSSAKGRGREWFGGAYTVDTTKNPKWIDVTLVAPIGNPPVGNLYGCYEVANGRLKMALGTKRATRPLEFADVPGVIVFDLIVTKPEESGPANDWRAEVHRLVVAGKFMAAERLLDGRLPGWSGLERAEGQLMLGVVMLERAYRGEKAESAERYRKAGDLFRAAAAEAGKAPAGDKRAAWVLAQADLRGLQSLWYGGDADGLLGTAERFAEKYHKTSDGLIVLSLMYHAYKKKGDTARAAATRERMWELFDALKDQPGAFAAETGEYSRAYWERTWFSEK